MDKKLYRSNQDYMLAGVCGGVGEFFGIDSTIIRLIWAIFFFAGGSGFLVYLLAALIVPKSPY